MKPIKKARKKQIPKNKLPWRKNPSKWTDTLFEKKLLDNPSLMTSLELASALGEYQAWRTSSEKYDWHDNPIAESQETEAPFSPRVLSNLLVEAILRLQLTADFTLGRLKSHA